MQRLQASLLLATFAAASCVALGGCGSSETAAPSTDSVPAPTTNPSPTPIDDQEPPPDLHAESSQQGDTFVLSVTGQEHYASGELSSFGLALAPRGEWHVNQEYPIHVTLAAEDGVTLPKAELERIDAAEFSERAVRFEVPFTAAAAGSPRAAAHVSFAMCTAENCMFFDKTVALALPVQ